MCTWTACILWDVPTKLEPRAFTSGICIFIYHIFDICIYIYIHIYIFNVRFVCSHHVDVLMKLEPCGCTSGVVMSNVYARLLASGHGLHLPHPLTAQHTRNLHVESYRCATQELSEFSEISREDEQKQHGIDALCSLAHRVCGAERKKEKESARLCAVELPARTFVEGGGEREGGVIAEHEVTRVNEGTQMNEACVLVDAACVHQVESAAHAASHTTTHTAAHTAAHCSTLQDAAETSRAVSAHNLDNAGAGVVVGLLGILHSAPVLEEGSRVGHGAPAEVVKSSTDDEKLRLCRFLFGCCCG